MCERLLRFPRHTHINTRTSSTLQMMVPSGMEPRGLTLPTTRFAFLPQYTNWETTMYAELARC